MIDTPQPQHPTRLSFILADEGRKQTWLAERLGVGRFRIHLLVKGVHPTEDEAAAIARALGREIDDVFPERVPV